ncbi:MAG TPA: extracellular solute-binding protein [Chloroflexota bacterium]|nr:extracellular solute-binding protein [Chloroflexota bacterium]
MAIVARGVTRRAVTGGAGAGAALLMGCGSPGREASPQPVAGPKEITWSCYQLGEARQKLWEDALRLAAQATGVQINVLWEPGQGYWDKRQTEAAAGSGGVDIMINQLNWVAPGGLSGLFPDHYDYMRRDKLDTKEFYKADLESWAWKGKLWAVPMQSGGGVFLFNKAMFDAKGVKYPHKDWTMDDLLDASRRLTDAQNHTWGLQIGQNGIHYQMGTFMYGFGGKRLNEARDKAAYGEDAGAIRGAEFDVDLHTKHKVTVPPEALANAPAGQSGMELNLVAMEFNGLFRHTNVRAAIGAQNLDFAPPPKGPTGVQRAAVAGNAWSIVNTSKAKDAAWAALRWTYTRDGQQSPLLEAVSWPPIVSAANSPKWLELFKGTRIADVSRVWETGGHDLLVLPEGDRAWSTMNEPVNRALRGEIGTRDALQESARQLDELFSQRPAAWK